MIEKTIFIVKPIFVQANPSDERKRKKSKKSSKEIYTEKVPR